MRTGYAAATQPAEDSKPGFSRKVRLGLTAMRIVAYSLASLFMVVMIVRGVWLTQEQMESAASRSPVVAAAALEGMARTAELDPAAATRVLDAIAPVGATLRLALQQAASPAGAQGGIETRTVPVAGTQFLILATIDHAAIRSAAWRINRSYILLVAALGIPVIVIFLVMGWLINQPALKLLSYAQAHREEPSPLALPALWVSVLARLQDLRDSQAQMKAFLDNAPVAMAFIDPATLNIAMINRHGAAYYGMEPEDMRQKGAAFLRPFFPSFDELLGLQLLTLRDTRKAATFEVEFRPSDREPMQLLATIFPVLDRNDRINLVGWITIDVSDERRAQENLNRSVAALHQSEKLAALGGMLAGVSHELNNPLAAVIGQAALLAEDLEHTEHADRISKIRRAADRCARIVQSFLAMARQKEPEHRSVEVNEQIRAAIELTEYQMRAANVRIVLDLQPDLPAIRADPDQLHQVIVNLLTNARQALEEMATERTITISSERRGNRIRVVVTDNGSGIDAATRDRVFDPFFTTKALGSGTGIGLPYSLGIIEAHGGTLEIEDAPVGTAFVITLPVQEGPTSSDAAPVTTRNASKGRVLVIDDEIDVAETLADMLQRMGLEVTVAVGGLDGLAAMAGGAGFEIVLSDIRMPDCDGATLFEWIATHRPDLSDRIGFVTGDTLSGAAADFIAAAGRPVLEKPFTPTALRELVNVMLGE